MPVVSTMVTTAGVIPFKVRNTALVMVLPAQKGLQMLSSPSALAQKWEDQRLEWRSVNIKRRKVFRTSEGKSCSVV